MNSEAQLQNNKTDEIFTTEKDWHYTIKSKRLGPVTENEIIKMLDDGLLDQNTKVWRKGMPDWVEIKESDIQIELDSPPPLPVESINNSWVWLVAFCPVIGVVLQYIVGFNEFQNDLLAITAVIEGRYWYVTFILNVAGCAMDELFLEKAGYSTKKFGWWLWMVPVYLFKRANHLRTGRGYAWAWIAMFIFSLILPWL